MNNNENNIGLYIHIPYCKAKCHYCDFNSHTDKDNTIPFYFDALKIELKSYIEKLSNFSIDTIFIGGGTPSYINEYYIKNLMEFIWENFAVSNDAEITIETNPGTITKEKILTYKDCGINRISMGLQTLNDDLLKKLGRIHSRHQFLENYELVKSMGIKNINIDLMFGIPFQSMDDFTQTLEGIEILRPSHISCYSLKIEDNTPFGESYNNGNLEMCDEDLDREMYHYAIDKFNSLDYEHYEISNFSLKGLECKHNLKYWKGKYYIGIGAGSHSYFLDNRYNNIYNIGQYISGVTSNLEIKENEVYIGTKDAMIEFIILGLRLTEGINIKEFNKKFGMDFFMRYEKETTKLLKNGLISINEDSLRLTRLGLDVSNLVFMEYM